MTVRRNMTGSSRADRVLRTGSPINDDESEGRAGQVGDRGSTIDAGRPRADGPKPDRQVSSPTKDDREPRFPAAGERGRLALRLGAPLDQPPDVRGVPQHGTPPRSPRLRNALTYWGAPRRHERPDDTRRVPNPPHRTGLSAAHAPHAVPEPEGDHLPDRPEARKDEHEAQHEDDERHQGAQEADQEGEPPDDHP